MASRPNFDPNRFSAYDAAGYLNPIISGTYEPGSTFKPIVMASALDAGAVTPTTTFNGTASVKVGDREIFNSEKKPYGVETMTQVIERSDNVGMVFVQRQMGGQKMYDYIQKFGFGTPTGIELSGEVSPGMTPIEQLYDVNFATMSFGQGIAVTPLQLMTAIGSFANQGKLMAPHVVEQIQHQDGKVETVQPKTIRQVVSPQAASQISGMMVRVVEAGAGKPATVPGYRIAGKTGTAQIPNGSGGYEEGTTIGNFVGFAPVEDPRFVMLVKVDRPKGVTFAEESAAPTFGELAKYLLAYYNVPPSKK
jgi:cell division protein FtsI/penicillin-binding protein 2